MIKEFLDPMFLKYNIKATNFDSVNNSEETLDKRTSMQMLDDLIQKADTS